MRRGLTHIKSRLSRSKMSLKWAFGFLLLLSFLALGKNFISNDVPIMGVIDKQVVFPAFKDLGSDLGLTNWKNRYHYRQLEGNYSFLIPTPIPYSSTNIDQKNAGFISPFGKQKVPVWYARHWLGTDQLGRDVLAGLISGCRVSLLVGFFTCLLALLIGIPLGLIAGYFGDRGLKVSWLTIAIFVIGISWLLYVFIYFNVWFGWIVVGACLLGMLLWMVQKLAADLPQLTLPIDSMVLRCIEIFKSIPALIIIFVFLGIMAKPGIWNIVLTMGVVLWFNIARYVRAELLSIREMDYIDAQRSIGQPDVIIMIKHCLRMALPPVLVSVVFLFASVILLESTLSFLGLGLPAEAVSWGSMLSESRKYFPAWWMALFPGIAILFSILSLHVIAQNWIKEMDPKSAN